MSILIRGMEMPKSCFYCPMRWKVDPDNIKCLATGEVFEETFTATIEMRNAGNCPLVEIPPHGRLIDADALMAKDEKDFSTIMEMTDPETVFGTALADAHTAIQEMLKTAPTIIEAEEGVE